MRYVVALLCGAFPLALACQSDSDSPAVDGGLTADGSVGGTSGGDTDGGADTMAGVGGEGGEGGEGGMLGGGQGSPCSTLGGECASGLFCELGACGDAMGVCQLKPGVCIAAGAPVCGCDGKDYSNDCRRRGLGTSKMNDGPCVSQMSTLVGKDKMCGRDNTGAFFECTVPLFCDRSQGSCDAPNAPGFCKDVPQACTRESAPVCGCDGKTYGNDCNRLAAKVVKDHDGACETTGGDVGAACGAGAQCKKGLVCDPAPGMCNVANASGTCAMAAIDNACPKILKEVCGCDGTTYGNDCLRLSAGVAKNFEGPCRRLLENGAWGGTGVRMTVKDANEGATLAFDCGAGAITGPLLFSPDGSFAWTGTLTPTVLGLPTKPQPATYTGNVIGTEMTLTVSSAKSSATYKLTFGTTGTTRICL